MRPSFCVLILAGGLSRRMGRDKRLLPGPEGTGLLQHVLDAARGLGAPVHVAVAPEQVHLPPLAGASLLWDRDRAQGPLVALTDAAGQIAGDVCVVAGDLAVIGVEDLREVVEGADGRPAAWVVLPVVEGRAQPLAAYYRRPALEALAAARAAGERSLVRALEGLPGERIHRLEVRRPEAYRSWNHPEDRRPDPDPNPEVGS